MNVLKIAAFSHGNRGGNPAGVVFCEEMPTETEMLATAKKVGYSETAFLVQTEDGWRIRYFAPEVEVPFCGHATIASGAALGGHSGPGTYQLTLNEGQITVKVDETPSGSFSVALQSPETWSKPAPEEFADNIMEAFGMGLPELDPNFPIRLANAGATHLIIVVNERIILTEMEYDFDRVKSLMQEAGVVTINLVYKESNELFHSRNAFAYGGVVEDPATGAAAAALGGYLRDIEWGGSSKFEVLQGEDMEVPCRLLVEYGPEIGEGVTVKGETRNIEITLRKITEETVGSILRLKVSHAQEDFVANNAVSIAEAHFCKTAWFRGIYDGDTPVGFVMLDQDEEKAEYYIWRFMIDEKHQGKGYGTLAIQEVIKHVRTLPNANELCLMYVPDLEGSPDPFYEKLGFVNTDEWDEDERIMKMKL